MINYNHLAFELLQELRSAYNERGENIAYRELLGLFMEIVEQNTIEVNVRQRAWRAEAEKPVNALDEEDGLTYKKYDMSEAQKARGHISGTPDNFLLNEAEVIVREKKGKIEQKEFAELMIKRMEYIRDKGLNNKGYVRD